MVSMQNITLISLYGRRETKKEMIGPVLARPGCQSSNLVLNPAPHKLNDEYLLAQQKVKSRVSG
jgi:hypothetical protein